MSRVESSRLLRLAAIAALAFGPALAPALAAAQTTGAAKPTVTVTDEKVRQRTTIDFPDSAFQEERDITRIVQELYGKGVEMSSGRSASPEIEEQLIVGQPMPDGANARPVDQTLAALLPEDATWYAVGENLVAIGPNMLISRVYNDMLP